MKIKGKKAKYKSKQEELPLEEGEGQKEGKSSKKKGKKESEGSRWAAVIVLLITLVAGAVFYVVGNGKLPLPEVSWEGWGLQSEFVIE